MLFLFLFKLIQPYNVFDVMFLLLSFLLSACSQRIISVIFTRASSSFLLGTNENSMTVNVKTGKDELVHQMNATFHFLATFPFLKS
jgi:hypothetical protein